MTVAVVPLKHLVSINERKLPETGSDPDHEFGYVDIGSVGRGELIEDPEQLLFKAAPSRARRLVREGDILLSTVRTYLRAVWPVDSRADQLVASTGFAVLGPGPSIHARYLAWWAQSDHCIEEIVARSVGVSYPAINPDEIGLIGVPALPFEEQKAIADYLDTETARIDALIAKKQRIAEAVRTRFAASRIALVLDATSEGAKVTPLARLVSQPVGGVWGDPPGEDEVDVACVRVADFDRSAGYLTGLPTARSIGRDSLNRLRLKYGDLLLEKSGGGDSQPVGYVAQFTRQTRAAVSSNFIARLRPTRDVDPNYLRHVFLAIYDARLNVPFIKQTTGIQNLDVSAYLRQCVKVPSIGNQTTIGSGLETRMARVNDLADRLNRQIELLRERRQALITAAVTGQMEVPGAA